jgi:hypothetical protein
MAYAQNLIAHQKAAFFAVYDAILGGQGGVYVICVFGGLEGLFPLYHKELRPVFGPSFR